METLRGVLGAEVEDERITKLIASLPGLPRVSEQPEHVFVSSPDCGIELTFYGTPPTLHAITLSGSGNIYRGTLPDDLTFNSLESDVVAKLGNPPTSTGLGDAMTLDYTNEGLSMDFREGRLQRIALLAKNPTTHPAAIHLTFHLVGDADRANDGAYEMMLDPFTQTRMPVSREVLLDETAARALMLSVEDRALVLELTDEASSVLSRISDANIGRRIAIVLDGKIITAPRIAAKIPGDVIIGFPQNTSDAEMRQIAGRASEAIRRARPTTRPR